MKRNQINNKPVYYILGLIVAVFFVIAFPYHQGGSLYAEHELWRDLGILWGMQKGELVFQGPPSSLGNFHFGPVYYYLVYPVTWLANFRPWALALNSLLFFAGTIVLSFFVVKKWWRSNHLALLVSGLMAFSIFTFQLAKYGSNPNFIPFFSLLFFYFLEKFTSGAGKSGDALGLGITFGIATQLHAIPLLSLPLILVYFLARKILRLRLFEWLLFCVATLAMYLPYLYYESTHGFANIKALVNIAASPTGQNFSERVVDYLLFWMSPLLSVHPLFDISDIFGLLKLLGLLAICGAFLVFLVHYDRKRRAPLRVEKTATTEPRIKNILTAWIVIPSLVLLLPIGAVQGLRLYYFLDMFPAIFFLIGLGLYNLRLQGFGRVYYYLLGTFLLFQGWQIYEYYRLLNSLG